MDNDDDNAKNIKYFLDRYGFVDYYLYDEIDPAPEPPREEKDKPNG